MEKSILTLDFEPSAHAPRDHLSSDHSQRVSITTPDTLRYLLRNHELRTCIADLLREHVRP